MIEHRPAIAVQMARWRARKRRSKLGIPAPMRTYEERKEYAQLEANYAAYEPPANPTPEDILIAAERSESIDRQIDRRLSARLARVVRLRYGLGDYPAQTLDQVGAQFGVCRERVRQMEWKAFGKLRKPWVAPLLDNPFYGRVHGRAHCNLYIPQWRRQELDAAQAAIDERRAAEHDRAEALKQERELAAERSARERIEAVRASERPGYPFDLLPGDAAEYAATLRQMLYEARYWR